MRTLALSLSFALSAILVLGCNDEVGGPDSPAGPAGPVDEPGPRVGTVVLKAEADTLWVNDTAQLLATVLSTDGDTLPDVTVAFTSSNEQVLEVSSTGVVTAVGPGIAAVTARAEDSSATVRLFAAAAAMAPMSGENQAGDVGKPLGEPLMVRVTDERGEGVAGIRVVWSVVSGVGDFLVSDGNTEGVAVTSTDGAGFARVRFIPQAVGSIGVLAAADVAGVKGSPVPFTVDGRFFLSDLPPFSGSRLVYDRVEPDSFGLSSSYVLYADGTFELQYSVGFRYAGKYTVQDKVIVFDFGESGSFATGTLRGDFLSVKYSIAMTLSDFEDGVYVRSR